MKFGLMAVASAVALLATVSVSNAAPGGRHGITATDSAVIQVAHDDDDVGYRHRRHRGSSGIVLRFGDGGNGHHRRHWRNHDDDDDNGYRHRRHWRHHDNDDNNGYHRRRHWSNNSDNGSGVSIRLGTGHRRHHVD